MKTLSRKLNPRSSLGLISSSGFIEGLAAGTIFITLPYSVEALPEGAAFSNWTGTERIGLLISAFGMAMFLGQLLAGQMARSVAPRRSLAVIGLAACAVGTGGLILAESFIHLVLLRTIQGFALALVIPTTASLLTAFSGSSSRGEALGFFTAAKTLGLALGPLAGGVLINHFTETNLQAVYGLGAGAILLACIPFFFLASPDPAVIPNEEPERPAPGPRSNQPSGNSPLFNPGLALGAFTAASCATTLPVFQNEFKSLLELDSNGIGIALSAMLLTRFLISWPVGRVADRVDEYRLIYAGLILLAGSTFLLGLTSSFPALLLARIIMGIGMALFSVPALRIVSNDPGSRDHTFRISLLTAAFSCGVGIGPLLTGLCAAEFGFRMPFIAWSLLSLTTAGFISARRGKTTRSRAEGPPDENSTPANLPGPVTAGRETTD